MKLKRMEAITRLVSIALGSIAISTACADPLTPGEIRAHALAKDVLPKLLASEMILNKTLEQQNMRIFVDQFEKPLAQIELSFLPQSYHKLGITDREMMVASSCGNAATELLQYGQALLRTPSPNWATYHLKQYREDIEQCKRDVKQPQPFRE